MTNEGDYPEGDFGFDDGPCSLCGKPTVRPWVEDIDEARGADNVEPRVCNKCLLDLRGDMATELDVRRRLTNLEGTVKGATTKETILYVSFTVAMAAASFVLGLLIGQGST